DTCGVEMAGSGHPALGKLPRVRHSPEGNPATMTPCRERERLVGPARWAERDQPGAPLAGGTVDRGALTARGLEAPGHHVTDRAARGDGGDPGGGSSRRCGVSSGHGMVVHIRRSMVVVVRPAIGCGHSNMGTSGAATAMVVWHDPWCACRGRCELPIGSLPRR